jgi:hypothetical protein
MTTATVIGGTYGLNLRGWHERSIWGYDPATGRMWATLWRNSNTNPDHPDASVAVPDVTGEPVPYLLQLAREIATVTGKHQDDPAHAIAESLGWAESTPR